MTERVDLAKDLEALAATLQKVLAIVSHDMRTPLAVIHTTTSMLLNPKYQLNPAQIREQHERIRRNAEQLNRMISDVVDMSNLRTGKFTLDPQAVDIQEPLRDAVAGYETQARDKGLTLTFQPGVDSLNAQADRARLTQLFQNLLANAVKFCKSGDRITVASRVQNGEALIEIADTGPGIAADDLPNLFNPHFPAREKHQRSGTGLGLYISKGIVEAHGGQIRCDSQPGTGTTFSIALPLAT